MANWASACRGEEGVEVVMGREAMLGLTGLSKEELEQAGAGLAMMETCAYPMKPPPFAALMPKMGAGPNMTSTRIPVAGEVVSSMKQSAAENLPEGKFVSTDDVMTARAWKAFVKMRRQQLGDGVSGEDVTAVFRAVNIRTRATPPLPRGYVGNGACTVRSGMTVAELEESSVQKVALLLREDLGKWNGDVVGGVLQWMGERQREGLRAGAQMKTGLDFICSSWLMPWETAVFETGKEVYAFDHGALIPIVCNFAKRQGGGYTAWTTGGEADVQLFAQELVRM